MDPIIIDTPITMRWGLTPNGFAYCIPDPVMSILRERAETCLVTGYESSAGPGIHLIDAANHE